MNAISYSELRQNLKSCMDKVCTDYEPLIITRKNGENIVLISINEYNALSETHYLLSGKENAAHLKKSIEQMQTGKIHKKELIELDDE